MPETVIVRAADPVEFVDDVMAFVRSQSAGSLAVEVVMTAVYRGLGGGTEIGRTATIIPVVASPLAFALAIVPLHLKVANQVLVMFAVAYVTVPVQ